MPDPEVFLIALRNIRHQRIRSYLTLLGIVIGIAAIVALVSVGEGLNTAVTGQFESLGMTSVFVEPGSGSMMSTAVARTIRESDIKIIEGIPGVEHVAAFYEASGIIKYGEEQASLIIIGIDHTDQPYMEDMGFLTLSGGRLLVPGDKYALIVPESFLEDAFEKEIGIRQRLELSGKVFKVVGAMEASDVAFSGFGALNFAWVPRDAVKEVFGQSDPLELAVKVETREQVDAVVEEIERRLEEDHGEKDFTVMSSENILESASAVIGLIGIVLVGIAAISLVVGGIGIMNTMVMAVMERTREIGVMKAIGATDYRIISLFLVEAGLFGLVGGTAGAALGFGMALAIGGIATSAGFTLPVAFDPLLMACSMAFALFVGIVSGIYPARRAAKLDPVEALRYE